MNKKLITFLIVGIIILLFLITYQLWSEFNKQSVLPTDKLPATFPTQPVGRKSQTIATVSGAAYSVVPLITNQNTKLIAEDFYQNTLNTEVYDIFYYETNGTVIILLYDENLDRARTLAEQQLVATLPYTKTEICDMQIRVQTNEYVSPVYSGINLGLSFCPGSVDL